jgi:hypothetical protein
VRNTGGLGPPDALRLAVPELYRSASSWCHHLCEQGRVGRGGGLRAPHVYLIAEPGGRGRPLHLPGLPCAHLLLLISSIHLLRVAAPPAPEQQCLLTFFLKRFRGGLDEAGGDALVLARLATQLYGRQLNAIFAVSGGTL